jgi:hypothetical protein
MAPSRACELTSGRAERPIRAQNGYKPTVKPNENNRLHRIRGPVPWLGFAKAHITGLYQCFLCISAHVSLILSVFANSHIKPPQITLLCTNTHPESTSAPAHESPKRITLRCTNAQPAQPHHIRGGDILYARHVMRPRLFLWIKDRPPLGHLKIIVSFQRVIK